MDTIEPPDLHSLSAARGWLELGNIAEAWGELNEILPRWHEHPEVLGLMWELHAADRVWAKALAVSRQMVMRYPKDVSGWIHQSYTLHELRQTEEARDLLVSVAEQFPEISVIPYNLACYECQLGNLEQARRWLGRAEEMKGKSNFKKMALTDPDLQPLWDYIKGL